MTTDIKAIGNMIRTAVLSFVCALPLAACGPAVHTAFQADPLVAGKTFSPRDRPAEIVAKQDQELLGEGYMLIGTVDVRQDEGGSQSADLTMFARREAAKRGGDLVTLISDNTRTSERRYKEGGCPVLEQRKVQYWQAGGTYCDRFNVCYPPHGYDTVYECQQREKIPYTAYFRKSEVKVFRRESAN
ncbi:MAG TPA: hypothetical protein VEJ22_01640 [Nitrospirota bacterium]|nr:hypothetical protein [Nitrospirota bacterium]